MKITCFIEYKIDPYKLEQFEEYAQNWGKIIPACGGDLVGYFLPHEGSNDRAFGLISFDSLADPDRLLSLSIWKDEAAVIAWRNEMYHREAQQKGRDCIFNDYRIRVADVLRDYGMNNRAEAPKDL